jgi:predicted acetyltransferase
VTNIDIRLLTLDDDLEAQLDLGQRAFGVFPAGLRESVRRRVELSVAAGRHLSIFADGSQGLPSQVGGALYFDMRQWWAGREVPMAGIAGVKVAPEARGGGVGRQLMTRMLRLVADRGYPLSTLYPATMPIYRSLGWELAGGNYHVTVPTRSLRDLAPPDSALGQDGPGSLGGQLRRVTADDAEEVNAVLGRVHQALRDCGPITRDPGALRLSLEDSPDHFRYLCDDGYISYEWRDRNEGLDVGWLAAASAGTQRGLLSLLAAASSTAAEAEFRMQPDGPLWWLLRERDASLVRTSMWMLRVVNAKAAIEARGFAGAVDGSVLVNLVDDALPENTGAWELTVAGGKGALTRAEGRPGALTLGARGLAAMYAGTPLPALRLAGLADGGAADDDTFLTAAFAGTAFMLDSF